MTVNSTEATAGKSIAGDIQAPSDTDIASVSIVVGGAGLDDANDTLTLDSGSPFGDLPPLKRIHVLS